MPAGREVCLSKIDLGPTPRTVPSKNRANGQHLFHNNYTIFNWNLFVGRDDSDFCGVLQGQRRR